jgi:UDP-N-acetylmuramate dehydrogenase
MPTIEHDISLQPFNTFGIEARARHFVHCHSVEDVAFALAFARDAGLPHLVLGGGSNVLLTRDFPGVVLRIGMRGIACIADTADAVLVRAAAGEPWHGLVAHALDAGWNGLENLSLIPGTVGAAPIQNIGAYGVELESVFDHLEACEIATGATVRFDRAACAFGYRDSVFKRGACDRYVILAVVLRLPKGRAPAFDYQDLRAAFAQRGIVAPTAREVSEAVIAIRRAKLPDPAVLGNAGSFFKNPVVEADKYEALKLFYPGLVGYSQPDGRVKLAAGWLIEQAGWKGRALGDAAVHERQALVLVNRGRASAGDVAALARAIMLDIRARFGVELESEPVWV